MDWPITDKMIAERLHTSVKRVRALARSVGCGRIAGRRLLFWEEDYNAMVEALPRPGGPTYAGPAERRTEKILKHLEQLAKKPVKRRRAT